MSRTLTAEQEKELLKQFEEMLDGSANYDAKKFNNVKLDENGDIVLFDDEDDFGTFATYPSGENSEYPDSPKIEENGCKHEKKKVVWISNNMKYLYCPSCKADLGDA